jgi:hypothetical protein
MGTDTLPFRVARRQKQEEKERRLAKFELIQGGLGSGGGTPPENWLVDFPVGSQFVCQSKMQRDNFMVLTLEIWRKTERTVRLWDIVADKLFADVNPLRFINSFELLETLYDPRKDPSKEEEPKQEEQTDG